MNSGSIREFDFLSGWKILHGKHPQIILFFSSFVLTFQIIIVRMQEIRMVGGIMREKLIRNRSSIPDLFPTQYKSTYLFLSCPAYTRP